MAAAQFVYRIQKSLYLNVTNRCSNHCRFCIRNHADGLAGYCLILDTEPEFSDMKEAIAPYLEQVDEIVFCGFGEPTYRVALMTDVCRWLRQVFEGTIRLNTNGQGDLINGYHILDRLEGLIDQVNISLNAPDSAEYQQLCHSIYGEAAYTAILDFIEQARSKIPIVGISAVSTSGVDMDRMEEIARDLGLQFIDR